MIEDQEFNKINQLLDTVCDPEIPVLTIRDLGILRDARLLDDGTATICFRTPLAQMTADALADTLELFAAQAQNWMILLGTPDAPTGDA